ncbi:unnamed protein product [Absidia cylindrospora]
MLHLRLTRRLNYARDYWDGDVRPIVVFEAAQYLTRCLLYREHRELNISHTTDWMDRPEVMQATASATTADILNAGVLDDDVMETSLIFDGSLFHWTIRKTGVKRKTAYTYSDRKSLDRFCSGTGQ